MMNTFNEMFCKYKLSIVSITVKLPNDDHSIGTGFHIGKGYIVTARHVIENNSVEEVSDYYSEKVSIKRIYYPKDHKVDLAILESDFSSIFNIISNFQNNEIKKLDYIEIGSHLDDWISDDDFVMTNVLLMGFPPIPFSKTPNLVAVKGEVNAIIDKYNGPFAHFIISSVPRGGFSGGPVISENGFLLGVLTESLCNQDLPAEVGFASVISIEPLIDLIYSNRLNIGDQLNFIKEFFGTE